MNLTMYLSRPVVYRRLFIGGLLIWGIGAVLLNIPLSLLGIVVLVLGKYGMRIEHKEKSKPQKQRSEIG